MVFAFEKIMEFTMKIDNLDLAYLVVEVMFKILEFQIFFTFRKLQQKVKQFTFEKIMDFAMNI